MSTDLGPEAQLKAVQAQLSLLTAQVASLTQQHQALLAQAAAPFAALQGLKEALAGVAVAGKEGTLAVNKGVDGALLLRLKAELLQTLDQAAQDILAALPATGAGYVMASDADLVAACKSEVWLQRFARQQKSLNAALQAASGPAGAGMGTEALGLGPALAAVQAVPLVLNALSDAGKFLRTDRSVSLFEAGDEVQRMLESLLERRAHVAGGRPSVQRIDAVTPELVRQAELLLLSLDALRVLHDRSVERLGVLQRAAEDAAKLPEAKAATAWPALVHVARLREEVGASKALLEALDPGLAPEQFWAQVSGQLRQQRLQGQGRIELRVKAQTVQVLEKRVWRADRLVGSGEVQVEYRITAHDGRLLDSGVRLYVSATRDAFSDAAAERWPLAEKAPSPPPRAQARPAP